jgi:predicted Co/Zn/Cd cation transporter (cation efflux family)
MKLVIWIAGVLGLSVIGLIWGLLTGQISLVFG